MNSSALTADLSGESDDTTLTHRELVQHHLSDWDFMLLRAEANAMLVHVNDGKIKISKPDTSTEPVLQVTYGTSILEFEAEMDARNQWKNVKATSWNYANQELFKADTSEATDFTQHGNISGSTLAEAINLSEYEMRHGGYVLEQELQDWVNGTMMRSRLAKIRGRTKCIGFSGIKPGDMIKLDGVGDRFNGNAYVTSVIQELGNGIWDTNIQFGLDPRQYAFVHKDIQDAPAVGINRCGTWITNWHCSAAGE